MADCDPLGIAGEVARKSSNAQWACRQFLRNYGVDLKGTTSSVSCEFITVGDADILWHLG